MKKLNEQPLKTVLKIAATEPKFRAIVDTNGNTITKREILAKCADEKTKWPREHYAIKGNKIYLVLLDGTIDPDWAFRIYYNMGRPRSGAAVSCWSVGVTELMRRQFEAKAAKMGLTTADARRLAYQNFIDKGAKK